jgi:hypothetical protein
MSAADEYRQKAVEFTAKAHQETRPLLRRMCYAYAKVYLRLAEQADRNAKSDIVSGAFLPPRDSTDPDER